MGLLQQTILNACEIGYIEVVQWLGYEVEKVTIQYGFARACCNQQFETLKFVKQTFGVSFYLLINNIACCPEAAWMCGGGNLEIVHWLYQEIIYEPKYLRANGNYSFVVACSRGYLEVAQWMAATCELTIAEVQSSPAHALSWEHPNIREWLAAEFGTVQLYNF
jgi:hypothetical protein